MLLVLLTKDKTKPLKRVTEFKHKDVVHIAYGTSFHYHYLVVEIPSPPSFPSGSYEGSSATAMLFCRLSHSVLVTNILDSWEKFTKDPDSDGDNGTTGDFRFWDSIHKLVKKGVRLSHFYPISCSSHECDNCCERTAKNLIRRLEEIEEEKTDAKRTKISMDDATNESSSDESSDESNDEKENLQNEKSSSGSSSNERNDKSGDESGDKIMS